MGELGGASPAPPSARLIPTTLAARLLRIYWWLVRPVTRGVRAILADADGRILLVRHTYTPGWYLPGGGVHKGESDEAALARELNEELGITETTGLTKLGEFLNTREHKRDTVAVFAAKGYTGTFEGHPEIEAVDTFDPRSLPADLSPGTRRRIEEWLGLARIDGRW